MCVLPSRFPSWARCRLQFLSDRFQTSHVDDERRNPMNFEPRGPRSKLAVCTIEHCWHDTGYSFCLITFKLHMQVVDERRNSIDFRSRGQRSRSTLAFCM